MTSPLTRLSILMAMAMACLAAQPAFAADTSAAPAAQATSPLAPARALIAARNWSGAIAELKRVNDSASADWNNLMGYSLRKGASPDLAGAEQFYDAALRINPTHRGALEYSGELYLMLGQLPRAEQRLAALDKACMLGCEEYTDLKNAVTRFKANGGRYTAAP